MWTASSPGLRVYQSTVGFTSRIIRQLQGILEAAFMSSTKEQLCILSPTFDWAADANLLNLAYMFSSPEFPTPVERLLTLLKTNGGCGSTNFFCPRFVAAVHLM